MVAATHAGANVSTTPKRSATKPKCDWCRHPFKRSRCDQRYCTPGCRRAACEHRARETAKAFVNYMSTYGIAVDWLTDYVERAPKAAKAVLVMKGFQYSEQGRAWWLH